MESTNVVVLVGRLTRDPELRSLASGTSVTSMRLAFNTSRKNQSTGEYEDVSNFVNVDVWGKHGETCAKYLNKGSQCVVNGRLAWREWESEGGKRQEISVTANRVEFVGPRDESRPVTSQVQAAPQEELEPAPF